MDEQYQEDLEDEVTRVFFRDQQVPVLRNPQP